MNYSDTLSLRLPAQNKHPAAWVLICGNLWSYRQGRVPDSVQKRRNIAPAHGISSHLHEGCLPNQRFCQGIPPDPKTATDQPALQSLAYGLEVFRGPSALGR